MPRNTLLCMLGQILKNICIIYLDLHRQKKWQQYAVLYSELPVKCKKIALWCPIRPQDWKDSLYWIQAFFIIMLPAELPPALIWSDYGEMQNCPHFISGTFPWSLTENSKICIHILLLQRKKKNITIRHQLRFELLYQSAGHF